MRYDLAIESPEYVKELAQHHTGGYLKIAPEALAEGPLSKMMKPGVGAYYRFKELFDRYSKEAGKEQYLIPYFIAAHPGTSDEDMLELALWLKKNGFRADQVQAFLPSPMATATAMYHSGKNPLKRITRASEEVLHSQGPEGAAPAQGVPALSRRQQLADAARGAAPHGPRRPDRQRQASTRARLSASRHRRGSGRAARRRASVPHAAHGCRTFRRAADATGLSHATPRVALRSNRARIARSRIAEPDRRGSRATGCVHARARE